MCLKSQQATPHTSVSPPGAPHAGNQFWAFRARGAHKKETGVHGWTVSPKGPGSFPEATCSGSGGRQHFCR